MMMMRGQTVWNCQKCGRRLQRCRCRHSLRPASCFPQKLRALRVLARVPQYLHRCFNKKPKRARKDTACHQRSLLTSVYISGRETMFGLTIINSVFLEGQGGTFSDYCGTPTFYICQNLISPVSQVPGPCLPRPVARLLRPQVGCGAGTALAPHCNVLILSLQSHLARHAAW